MPNDTQTQPGTPGTPPAAPAPPAAPTTPPASSARGTADGAPIVAAPDKGTAGGGKSPPPGKAAPPSSGKAAPPPAAGARITISQTDLDDRLARAKASQLKKLFGTDDPKAVQARMAQLTELEQKAEEERKAQLTEIERVREEAAVAKQEAEKMRSKLAAAKERESFRQQSELVKSAAATYVNPAALDEAAAAFGAYLRKQGPERVAKMTEKDIGAFFSNYVKTKPFMAREAAAPAGGGAPPARRPAGSATPPPRPRGPVQTSAPGAGGKTMRPGQANSMTPAEARQAAAAKGYRW